jgi:hypothetical protein
MLPRVASAEAQRAAALRGSGVAYTGKDVTTDPSTPEADTTAQDSSNAAV